MNKLWTPVYVHLSSFKVLFHASNQTKKKWNILIIIDNKTRFVLLSLFLHFSDLTPGTNLMNKSWSNAACARQHIIIWNYISSSNVNTPEHLWWKNTHAFQIVHRDQTQPLCIRRQSQLAASVHCNQETALWVGIATGVYKAHSSGARPAAAQTCPSVLQRVSFTIKSRQEGKQQNKHGIYYVCSGRRNVPITCHVWQLRFRKCKMGVLFWTILQKKMKSTFCS